MAARQRADPAQARRAVLAAADWLRDESHPAPDRDALAAAVRLTPRTLAAVAPGASVEVRIPQFAAVQCIIRPTSLTIAPPDGPASTEPMLEYASS